MTIALETPVWHTVPDIETLRGLVMDPETARDQHGHQYERMDRAGRGLCRCGCCNELFSGEGYRAPIPDTLGRRWLYVCLEHDEGQPPPWRRNAAVRELEEAEEPEGVPG